MSYILACGKEEGKGNIVNGIGGGGGTVPILDDREGWVRVLPDHSNKQTANASRMQKSQDNRTLPSASARVDINFIEKLL